MASMAALATTSTLAAASAVCASNSAARSSSSSSSGRSGIVALPARVAPAKRRSSFNGRALRPTPSSSGGVAGSWSHFVVRAASSEDAGTADGAKQADELVADLKAKWDGLENKSTVAIYAGGALVTLWLSSTVIGAVNSVPLLPKLLELVGLGYTGWFVYRYLLFKSSRKELVSDIEELKGKIVGATTSITGTEEK